MARPFEREIGGKRFKFMHGHEVDPVNKGDTPGTGRICCIIAGMAEDKNGSPVLYDGEFVEDTWRRLGTILEDITGRFRGLNLGSRARWGWFIRPRRTRAAGNTSPPLKIQIGPKECLSLYYEDMEDNGYDVLIAGHTHQPGRIEDWYFNSGTWARKTNSFVQVSPDGDAAVFDWIDGQPEPNNTVLEM